MARPDRRKLDDVMFTYRTMYSTHPTSGAGKVTAMGMFGGKKRQKTVSHNPALSLTDNRLAAIIALHESVGQPFTRENINDVNAITVRDGFGDDLWFDFD